MTPAAPRRVMIRFPMASDEAEFTTLRRDSRDFLERWEPVPPFPYLAFTTDDFDNLLANHKTDTRRRFLVVRVEDNRILGQCSLSHIMRGPLQQAYLGYWIGHLYAGQGYMTEALQLVLAHAFGELLLHRVEANIQPHNTPSIKLALGVGFRYEGFSPKYIRIAGHWADHNRYAMLNEEFWSRYPDLKPPHVQPD